MGLDATLDMHVIKQQNQPSAGRPPGSYKSNPSPEMLRSAARPALFLVEALRVLGMVQCSVGQGGKGKYSVSARTPTYFLAGMTHV